MSDEKKKEGETNPELDPKESKPDEEFDIDKYLKWANSEEGKKARKESSRKAKKSRRNREKARKARWREFIDKNKRYD